MRTKDPFSSDGPHAKDHNRIVASIYQQSDEMAQGDSVDLSVIISAKFLVIHA
ncbi:MAG TPA: hypothetical protein VMW24_13205 [Sedimentisphaerales bacterium]|nr:hypothetical protein [Sedimentisphaerales bacterium]